MAIQVTITNNENETFTDAYGKLSNLQVDTQNRVINCSINWYKNISESCTESRIVKVDEYIFDHLNYYRIIEESYQGSNSLQKIAYLRIIDSINDVPSPPTITDLFDSVVAFGGAVVETSYRGFIMNISANSIGYYYNEKEFTEAGDLYLIDPTEPNRVIAEAKFILLRDFLFQFGDVVYGDRNQYNECEVLEGEKLCQLIRWSTLFDVALTQMPKKK